MPPVHQAARAREKATRFVPLERGNHLLCLGLSSTCAEHERVDTDELGILLLN